MSDSSFQYEIPEIPLEVDENKFVIMWKIFFLKRKC